VPDAILNRRHWAAVGLLGSAHLIADQGDKEFDEQKMAVVRDKYFIPFLVALLQRLALNRGIEEAGKLLSSATPKVPESLVVLRDDLLRFAIEGHFTQVSSRHALHRFYLLAREGLDVPCAWDEVRRAIADLEARFSAQRQSQIAQGIARNIRMVARVQSIAEVVEIFIVSVYAAHLWDMFAKGNEFLETHLLPDWRPWIIHGGVIAFALLGGLITLLLVRPWRHEDQSD
jgi:hypothetical protein